jgi:hypothetical protein
MEEYHSAFRLTKTERIQCNHWVNRLDHIYSEFL